MCSRLCSVTRKLCRRRCKRLSKAVRWILLDIVVNCATDFVGGFRRESVVQYLDGFVGRLC